VDAASAIFSTAVTKLETIIEQREEQLLAQATLSPQPASP
jgi:hypothetical protein